MISRRSVIRLLSLCIICVMTLTCIFWYEPVYAASSANKETLITSVKNPSNGVIKYIITAPPGEKVDYSVELTPDKKYKVPDVSHGSWKNRTKKTVKKTITVKVKCLSDRYRIKASYTTEFKGKEITYSDEDKAVSTLKTSVVTSKFKWDFSRLGKGQKEWKYRYKYVPYKNGIKKYVEVFNKNNKKIKSYLKETIPVTKITELIELLRARI